MRLTENVPVGTGVDGLSDTPELRTQKSTILGRLSALEGSYVLVIAGKVQRLKLLLLLA